MHSSHTLDQLDTCFDDIHAIANAGLLLTATLAGLRLEAPACSPAPTGNRRSPTPWRGRPARGTVEQLLALARGTGAARDRLEMEEVLPRVERGWHGRLAADGRPLRVRVEGDLPPVRASTEAVTQVMDVLVGNAAEHGAGTVTVRPGLPRRAGRGGQRRGPGRGRGTLRGSWPAATVERPATGSGSPWPARWPRPKAGGSCASTPNRPPCSCSCSPATGQPTQRTPPEGHHHRLGALVPVRPPVADQHDPGGAGCKPTSTAAR